MASGFGFTGGRSRCFTFWQEFQKCYANADSPNDCVPQKEDYMECLHHGKEIEKAKTIKEHYLIQRHKEAKKNRESGELRATSNIMKLGLMGDDEKPSSSSSSSESSGSGGEEAK